MTREEKKFAFKTIALLIIIAAVILFITIQLST